MEYVVAGLVCILGALCYLVGYIKGYNTGYSYALQDVEKFALEIKKKIHKMDNLDDNS